jgi:hypothetical protein
MAGTEVPGPLPPCPLLGWLKISLSLERWSRASLLSKGALPEER